MRVVIVREDNAVLVDGVPYAVDCSTLPADIHAVQWDGLAGEVEYSIVACSHCGSRSKKGNEFIRDLAPYQKYVDGWHAAKAEADAIAAREAEEQAKKLFAPATEPGVGDAAG